MIDNKDLSESTLRFILWEALGTYSTPALLKLLDDDDYIVRTAAAKQLQRRSEEIVFETAKAKTTDQKAYKREIGAFLLGQLGSPNLPYKSQSIHALLRLLEDSDSEVRAASVAALGHLGSVIPFDDEKILNKSLMLLNDSSDEVRVCLAFALGSFLKTENLVSALTTLRRDTNKDVVEWASTSLEIITTR